MKNSKFDIYMQIGSLYKEKNAILIAYGAYSEAIKYCEEEQKVLIGSYLQELSKKIEEMKENCNSQLTYGLLELVEKEMAEYASYCMYHIMEFLKDFEILNHDNAILFHCFNIFRKEREQGINGLQLDAMNFEEIKAWYYKVKFLVRRVDMDCSDERELRQGIEKNNISLIAIWYMVDSMCFYKNKVMKYM